MVGKQSGGARWLSFTGGGGKDWGVLGPSKNRRKGGTHNPKGEVKRGGGS